MDNRPARHAADMLEQSAGVYSSVSQQDPSLSVNIRGIQDYGRVNMNIDGMRQNFQKAVTDSATARCISIQNYSLEPRL